MKKITAFVNTSRVHWLVEELEAAGIKEIMVTEYFRTKSQISRLDLFCEDQTVHTIREVVHRLGTTGSRPDHDIVILPVKPGASNQIPIGQRMSRLEEPLLKQLVLTLFKGATRNLSLVFLVTTLSIFLVGLFIHVRLLTLQRTSREASENIRLASNATLQIQTAHLRQLVAAERLHKGDAATAFADFETSRTTLMAAAMELRQSHLLPYNEVDSLANIEDEFQSMMRGMLHVVSRLSGMGSARGSKRISDLSKSHRDIMTSLEVLHARCVGLLTSLGQEVKLLTQKQEALRDEAFRDVRMSLTALLAVATVLSLLVWLVAERKIARPLHVLVDEVRINNLEQLR